MAHSLTTTPAAATPISAKSKNTPIHGHSLGLQRVWSSHGDSKPFSDIKLVHRRTLTLGLTAVVLGLDIGGQNANAARRPPPPPPEEKKDPNVSGLQAKVLASKKRKEALKEFVAKQREKGKAGNQPSELPSNEPSE